MALFQHSIISRRLGNSDRKQIKSAYVEFSKNFLDPAKQKNIRNTNEEQYRGGFLIDLFVKVLGYTKNPDPNYNLIAEQKNVKDGKKADGAIIINGVVKAVIELKGTDTTDLNKIETQAFGYKNNQQGCVYVIISNFEKLRFYIDNAIEYIEFNLFTLTEAEFELLYLCLAHENIVKDLPKQIKDESLNQEDIVTKKLYNDYSLFKRELFQNLVALNPNYEPLELFKKSQKLLDRFLFLLFAEDRHLLPPNSVKLILNDWRDLQERDVEIPLYNRFKKYFEYLNTGYAGKRYEVFAYNGGLFKLDEILDAVKIDDELLFTHTLKLSEYDFASEVDVNILGHIFENSLNELDEIKAQLEGQEVDKTKTKRKKDGVFYTPKYITKYIVDNTVGKLCAEKKAELQLNEDDYTNDKRITKQNKITLVDKLTAYRNWLLQLTICDPACGSGAFLNQALVFLINEHKYIDELRAKLYGDALELNDFEKVILENNLFGVDLNEESVEIAKLSLWLRTAHPNRKLNDLNNNIKCGNSLIDDPAVAGDKAFNWQNEFPQVFKNGGFDVVIGNPPYFNIQTLGIGSPVFDFLKLDYFDIYQDKSDILFYFIKKALDISKNNVSFIVSNAFLFADKALRLRNWLLDNADIVEIINFETFLIFQDASITSLIINLNKGSYSGNTRVINFVDKNLNTDNISNQIRSKKGSYWVPFEKNESWALVKPNIKDIYARIDSNHSKLEDLMLVGKGMETAANEVFLFDSIPLDIPEKYFKKRISGINIGRYYIDGKTDYLLYFENVQNFEDLPLSIQTHLLNNKHSLGNRATVKNEGRVWWRYSRPMHKENYHLPKLFCSYRASTNAFVIDEYFNLITLTNGTVVFETNKNFSIKYIMCLLNSKLLTFRYKGIGKQTGSGVYEFFAVGVGKLPIPNIETQQQPFIEKADLMLSLNKDLQELSQKFLRSLEREFGLTELSKKLQDWYLLSYGDFINELSKKKINLSLAQKAEWEEYFVAETQKALDLKTAIETTDKTIDLMVYELYGLNEAEIAIVEGEG